MLGWNSSLDIVYRRMAMTFGKRYYHINFRDGGYDAF